MLRSFVLGCLASGAAASPAEADLSALVQREVLTHRSQGQQGAGLHAGTLQLAQAAAAGFSQMRLTAGRLQAPKGGVLLKRKIRAPVEGATAEFHLEPGCRKSDKYGGDECMMSWKDDIRFTSSIHIPSGLKVGDTIEMGFTLKMSTDNSSSPIKPAMDYLWGSKRGAFKMTMKCGLCAGTCVQTSTNEANEWTMETEMPTIMEEEGLCQSLNAGEPMTDWTLADLQFKLPDGPPAEWQVRGKVTVDAALARAGSEMLAASGSFELLPAAQPARLDAVPGASSLFAVPPLALLSLGETTQRMWADTVAAVASNHPPPGAVELHQKRSGKRSGELNAFLFKFMDVKIPDQSDYSMNMSMTNAEHCKVETDGDTVCSVPFGQSVPIASKMHFEMDLEPGSYMKVKSAPKVGGPFGKMFKKFLPQPQEVQVPLCGDHMIRVKVGEQSFNFKPGKCGFYRYSLDAPKMEFSAPDFANMDLEKMMPANMPKMPIKMSSITHLPPMGMDMDFGLYHRSGKPIMEMETEVTLDHQG